MRLVYREVIIEIKFYGLNMVWTHNKRRVWVPVWRQVRECVGSIENLYYGHVDAQVEDDI